MKGPAKSKLGKTRKRRPAPHPILILVGEKIRALRDQQDYSQDALANIASIDRAHVGGIERGEKAVTVLTLVRIASALQLEIGDLFPALADLEPHLEDRAAARRANKGRLAPRERPSTPRPRNV
jgi:transcriptional regulator with XRE-family HTH domain